jgi:hypothetical protein
MGLIKVDFDDTFAMVLTHDILPTAAPEFKKQTEDGSSPNRRTHTHTPHTVLFLFLPRNNIWVKV